MTTEIRTNAMNSALSALDFSNENFVKARVGKKDCYLYKTDVVDDNGLPVWVQIALTVKSNDATETREGFDADAAMSDYLTHVETVKANAEKPKKGKTADPAVAERKEARKQAIRNWASTIDDHNRQYTAKEVYELLNNEELFPTPMLVGSTMASLVEEGVFDLEVKESKKHYTVR